MGWGEGEGEEGVKRLSELSPEKAQVKWEVGNRQSSAGSTEGETRFFFSQEFNLVTA